jgi:hypothetical protein
MIVVRIYHELREIYLIIVEKMYYRNPDQKSGAYIKSLDDANGTRRMVEYSKTRSSNLLYDVNWRFYV